LESVQTAETIPMPVDIQVGLIMRETTIHQRVVGLEAVMIRMGILGILIEIEFDKTKDLDYNKRVQTNNAK